MADTRLRVAHVVDNLYVGGAQSVLLATLALLDPERVESVVVNLGGGAPELIARAQEHAPVLHVVDRALWDLGAVRRLQRLLRFQRIDVVHAHLTSSLVHGAVAGRLAGIPSVATLHNVVGDRQFEGRLAGGRLRRRAAELVTARLVNRLVAVSGSVRDSHVDELHIPADRIEVIPNIPLATLALGDGFDPAAKRRELGLDGPVVTSASRMTETREHDVLVRAFATVAAEIDDATLLLLAGGLKEPELKELVHELGIEDRVRFLGTRHDVAEIMAVSDVFCQPAKHEGMPMAVLEAMSLGVPVVASRVPGLVDTITDGETGLLVTAGDDAALAEALLALLRDRDRGGALGAAARAATARPTPAEWGARFEQIYRDLARGAGETGMIRS